jgi:hypothetical protein
MIVFVLNDMPTTREGWMAPREHSVLLHWHFLRRYVICRYRWSLPLWRHPRPSVRWMAVLPRTEAREYRSPSYTLDGAAAHEAVDMDARARSLRRNADNSVRQLGSILLLAGLGTAVLPNLSQLDPDSNHAPHIAHVLHGYCGKRRNRSNHWTRRRRLHSWCAVSLWSSGWSPWVTFCFSPTFFFRSHGHAPDWMCERLLRRD